MLNRTALDPNARTVAQDLYEPALFVLAQAEINGIHEGVTSAQMRQALRQVTVLSEEDKEITAGDKVSRFDRTWLNFVSHKRLTRDHLARYTEGEHNNNGSFRITTKGLAQVFDTALTMVAGEIEVPEHELQGEHEERTLERDLHDVVLLALARLQVKHDGAPVSTTEWRQEIKRLFPTSTTDREPLLNRKDTKFDQTIRNFISHNTLLKSGLMTRDAEGKLSITNRGKAEVLHQILGLFPLPPFLVDAVAKRQTEALQARVAQGRAEAVVDVPEAEPSRGRRPSF